MRAVIMVGGQGLRLRPLTENIPKPLLPVAGKPLLHSIIDHLQSHGVSHIYLATNYKADMFEEQFGDGSMYGVSIKYSHEKEPLGTGGPLKLIEKELLLHNEPFFVMNGDLLTDADLGAMMRFHREKNASMTIGTRVMSLPLAYGTVETEGDKVIALNEKPNIEKEINAGIYIINPAMLKLMPQGRVLMTDFIRLLVKDHLVCRYRLEGMWIDIGQFDDYQRANEVKRG
jgi:NDP-sugar pyrophosphorylase family protein